jgi:signal transduction histidine kinase/HAMP domain-containing protein/CheY-like chemotaxis protein
MNRTTETASQRQPAQASRLPPGQHRCDQHDVGLTRLLAAMRAIQAGDFGKRAPVAADDVVADDVIAEICTVFNDIADRNQHFRDELARVGGAVARNGLLHERLSQADGGGGWPAAVDAANALMDDLTRPLVETSRVLAAVADGDLSQYSTVSGQGDVAVLAETINSMTATLRTFASEVTRVAREVGTEGRLGGQARVPGVSGTWKDLTDSVNLMAGNLTAQVRDISSVATGVARGDLSRKITVDVRGEMLELKTTINTMVDQLSAFASEVTRVAREVGTEGELGGQAQVPGVAGTWKDLTDSVNLMAGNLTAQVRNIAQVATAVAQGDLSQKITVDVRGEILELKDTINTMVDQLSAFASEVTRVAREVGTEGELGGQAQVPGVAGTWKDLTDSVNLMAGNLTAQVRNIAQVTTAVAQGDLTKKIDVDARGEIQQLKTTINTMVDQLSAFADEVTRVAREVGTEGNLGGQARVRGVSGTWKDLTDNVNVMANNLTGQVRSIATVATAVAGGDLSKKITIEAKGEVAALAGTINVMVDTLLAFADEVTRVAREVGTEGQLGGQARVPNVAGTWKDLTDNVNFMANNLTSQVRNIAQVTTAVAQGDLTKKIDVDARGEILELKTTINTMVDQLSAFASEVTRVAREVGTAGILGGQAEVEGVSGTWKKLTESVNQLAGNLTTQVRAIAGVATAVTEGDLTRRITVDASGEVAELKGNINQMIANLGETTRANELQDWLKTNLARISGLLQGHRDLAAMAAVIMGELAPLVSAQHGAFFLAETADGPVIAGEEAVGARLRQLAAYGYAGDPTADRSFAMGQGLVGQVAVQKRTILVTGAPAGYVKVSSGLGWSEPANVIVLPVLFQGQVLGVIELASVNEFFEVHRDFLEQLKEVIGVAVNTITTNSRTDSLLHESQRLTGELRSRQQELQASNAELEDKAALLARQNRDIELKTAQIEQARLTLEERAQQLALASKVKSEFMANMSHELRTPLNSLLILAKLLADNPAANLTTQQVDFARTIHTAGSDLLQLINDVLDLAKVEAGRMDIREEPLPLEQLVDYVEATFQPLAAEKGLDFTVDVSPLAPASIITDEQRVQQVLRNLLSNAVKFTDNGGVTLRVAPVPSATTGTGTGTGEMLAFAVSDTGCGIASEKLQIIFEAFQQADGTTSRQYGGTGLGLSISRELTQLLGGELKVVSAPNNGSTFTLYLPGQPERGRGEPPASSDGHRTALPRPGPSPALAAGQPRDRDTARSDSPTVLVVERSGQGILSRAAASALAGIAGIRDRVEVVTEHTADGAARAMPGLQLVSVMLDLGLRAADARAVLDAVASHSRGVPVLVYEPAGDGAGARLLSAYGGRCQLETVRTSAQAAERLTLYLLTGIPQQAGPLEETSDPADSASRFTGEKILVIDDDVRNVFALTSALELHGLNVLYADNGRTGIEMLTQHDDIALVLMDIMMPGMDGYATTAGIRKLTRFADLPIIAVTAKAMKGDREKSLAAGTNEHVTKPVDVDRLLGMIQAMLARQAAGQPKRTAIRQVSSSVSDRAPDSSRAT